MSGSVSGANGVNEGAATAALGVATAALPERGSRMSGAESGFRGVRQTFQVLELYEWHTGKASGLPQAEPEGC